MLVLNIEKILTYQFCPMAYKYAFIDKRAQKLTLNHLRVSRLERLFNYYFRYLFLTQNEVSENELRDIFTKDVMREKNVKWEQKTDLEKKILYEGYSAINKFYRKRNYILSVLGSLNSLDTAYNLNLKDKIIFSENIELVFKKNFINQVLFYYWKSISENDKRKFSLVATLLQSKINIFAYNLETSYVDEFRLYQGIDVSILNLIGRNISNQQFSKNTDNCRKCYYLEICLEKK